jgi:isopenicillin N synthase-like dioxygenase
MSHVPIIDFSPFLDPQSSPEAKRGAALGIDKACREIGFFYLSNHGIDEELRSAMLSRAKTFFEEATEDQRGPYPSSPMVLEVAIMHVDFKESTEAGKGNTRHALEKNTLIILALTMV